MRTIYVVRLAKYCIFRVRQAHTGETGESIGANKGDYTHTQREVTQGYPIPPPPDFVTEERRFLIPQQTIYIQKNYIHTKGPPLKFLNNKK